MLCIFRVLKSCRSPYNPKGLQFPGRETQNFFWPFYMTILKSQILPQSFLLPGRKMRCLRTHMSKSSTWGSNFISAIWYANSGILATHILGKLDRGSHWSSKMADGVSRWSFTQGKLSSLLVDTGQSLPLVWGPLFVAYRCLPPVSPDGLPSVDVYILISSFYKDTSPIGPEPTLPNSFTLRYLFKEPMSTDSHILKNWGLGKFQHMDFGRCII